MRAYVYAFLEYIRRKLLCLLSTCLSQAVSYPVLVKVSLISAKFGLKCHEPVTFEKPGEKSPGFPCPTAAYSGAGSIR